MDVGQGLGVHRLHQNRDGAVPPSAPVARSHRRPARGPERHWREVRPQVGISIEAKWPKKIKRGRGRMGLAGSGRATVFFADVCLEMEILINPNKRFCLPFGLPKRNSMSSLAVLCHLMPS